MLKKIVFENLDQFLSDLNNNFAVWENSPLYKGIPGAKTLGDAGLAGTRGNQFMFVNFSKFMSIFNDVTKASEINLDYLNNKIDVYETKQQLLGLFGIYELVHNDIIVLTNSIMLSYDINNNILIDTKIAFNQQTNLLSSIENKIEEAINFKLSQNSTLNNQENIFEPYSSFLTSLQQNSNLPIIDLSAAVFEPFLTGNTYNGEASENHKYFGYGENMFPETNDGTFIFGSIRRYFSLIEATIDDNNYLTSDYAPGVNNIPTAVFLQDTENNGILFGMKNSDNLKAFGSIYKDIDGNVVIKSDSSKKIEEYSQILLNKIRLKYDKNVEIGEDLTVYGELVLPQFKSVVLTTNTDGKVTADYSIETDLEITQSNDFLTQITYDFKEGDVYKNIPTSTHLKFLFDKINGITSKINSGYVSKNDTSFSIGGQVTESNRKIFTVNDTDNVISIGKNIDTVTKFYGYLNLENYKNNVLITDNNGTLLKTYFVESIQSPVLGETIGLSNFTNPLVGEIDFTKRIINSTYIKFLFDKINAIITETNQKFSGINSDFWKKSNFNDFSITGLALNDYFVVGQNINNIIFEADYTNNQIKIGKDSNTQTEIVGDIKLDNLISKVLITNDTGKIIPDYTLPEAGNSVDESFGTVPANTTDANNLIASQDDLTTNEILLDNFSRPYIIPRLIDFKWLFRFANAVKLRFKNTYTKTETNSAITSASSGIKMMAVVWLAPDGTSYMTKGSDLVKAVQISYDGGADKYTVKYYSDLAKTNIIPLNWIDTYCIFNLQNIGRGVSPPYVDPPSNQVIIDISGGDSFGALILFKVI